MQRKNKIVDKLYHSKEWKACKKAYMQSMGYLCERCRKKNIEMPAYFCHHKIYVTVENIHDTSITLCFDNLEALCKNCHNKEHFKNDIDYTFDENGDLIPPTD